MNAGMVGAGRSVRDDGAKIKQLEHGAFVNLAHFDIGGNRFDTRLGGVGSFAADRGDGD